VLVQSNFPATNGDQQWLLAELTLPYIGLPKINRTGPNNTFTRDDFKQSIESSALFYCPSTGNYKRSDEAWWPNPSKWGAFMDYAQIWNWVGPFGVVNGDAVKVFDTQGVYFVFDDEQEIINFDKMVNGDMFRLPFNVSKPLANLPNSSPTSRVPMMMDYMSTVGRDAGKLRDDFQSGKAAPTAGNHAFTGRASSGATDSLKGGNFGFEDGSVQWRTRDSLKPRLMINRTFEGSVRPTYWW
jgi:hypothetical protein